VSGGVHVGHPLTQSRSCLALKIPKELSEIWQQGIITRCWACRRMPPRTRSRRRISARQNSTIRIETEERRTQRRNSRRYPKRIRSSLTHKRNRTMTCSVTTVSVMAQGMETGIPMRILREDITGFGPLRIRVRL